MPKLSSILAIISLLLISACGENSTSPSGATDQHTNLLEFEQKTLEQASALEETLHKSFNQKIGSLQ